ncbi:hypothetical protein FEM48_Zijuj05G0003800 [Ziziphus jujuba var. spinosa]|uniref:Uncharacterized protein n=1 Tax=Ziziphus jujuba var. spinosa TaxID=714518 RepID=A0A978VBQ1_ZIZJJ|nr:hypothetical protein FEM48_Zijuj05G0003800 [Ziziphus jujuba var. spinosa]
MVMLAIVEGVFDGSDSHEWIYKGEQYFELKQVEPLIFEFKRLSEQIDEFSERFLVGAFIAGLWDDIHLDVKIKQPSSFANAIGVARLIEERNQWQKKNLNHDRLIGGVPIPRAVVDTTVGVLRPPLNVRTSS